MNLTDLKTELDTDPLTKGYSGMSDPEVAAALAIVDETEVQTATAADMLKWTAVHDIAKKLDDAVVSGNIDQRRLARAALLLLSSPHIPELHLNDPEVMGMVDALVALGVFTSAEKDDLVARATRPVSRGVKLFGKNPTPSDVANARRIK